MGKCLSGLLFSSTGGLPNVFNPFCSSAPDQALFFGSLVPQLNRRDLYAANGTNELQFHKELHIYYMLDDLIHRMDMISF
jgi:hypothetical protein